MDFSDITIVSITGHSSYTLGSMYAIQRSCMELPGAKGLLISPNRPDNLPEHIQHISCKPFSYLEYNIFVIYSLADFIKTEFCLIVQNDGWVLNGTLWQDKFFDYDYLGPAVTDFILYDDHDYPTFKIGSKIFTDMMQENRVPDNARAIFNGGFSLRSQRLLKMPRELNLRMEILPPDIITTQPVNLTWRFPLHHEDITLTTKWKNLLIQQGIRFPDMFVATEFAFESSFFVNFYQRTLHQSLGGHFVGFFELVGQNKIQINYHKFKASYQGDIMLTEEIFLNSLDVKGHIELFHSLGYEMCVV